MTDLEKWDIAIEVLERQIDIIENSRSVEPDVKMWYDQIFQLRNGKAYLENIKPFILGSIELLEMDREVISENS